MKDKEVSPTIFTPTPNVLSVAKLLNEAIGRALKGYETSTLPWRYEADFEARTLMWLVIRNSEGVYELACKDLVLLPAGLSAARSAFEIAVRALWLLDPKDPFERETRWLAQLATEDSYHERMAKRLGELGVDSTFHRESAKSNIAFRSGVAALLPVGYKPIHQIPKLEAMMVGLNLSHLYRHYMFLSQFAHGTHVAGSLHRKGLGTGKRGGEFVNSSDWRYPLELCFFSVTKVAGKLAETMGGNPRPYLTDAFYYKFETALKRLEKEKVITDGLRRS